jgi:hypothetical protein
MQGHLPGPPQPHIPPGFSPLIGYVATREPQPLDARPPEDVDWLESDVYDEPWSAGHRPLVKVTALVLSFCLVVAGVGTVLEILLSAH